jgi:flagellar motor switch protein FliG
MTATQSPPPTNGNHPLEDHSESAELARMTGVQKLAALLLMLAPEHSTLIMKNLDELELEAVSAEMAKFETISQGLQRAILNDFSPSAVEAVASICGGMKSVKALLEQSVGMLRASDILCRVSPLPAPVAAMQDIVAMDTRHIFNLLRHEQIQTMVLVASYLPPEKTSQLLTMLRPEQRDQVVQRLATLSPTSVEVVEDVADMLHRKFVSTRPRALTQTGGVKIAAQVLNALPKSVSESILVSLKENNNELAKAVLKKMLTFEELEWLDKANLQKILTQIDMRVLTVALKTASDKLRASILSGLSKRAAESVREEISYLGPLKLSEIDAAQTEIVETVRRLESNGEIDLESIRQNNR